MKATGSKSRKPLILWPQVQYGPERSEFKDPLQTSGMNNVPREENGRFSLSRRKPDIWTRGTMQASTG